MNTHPTLATRFARNTHVLRSDTPLGEDQMRRAAPSIFADRQARQPLRALHLHPDHRGPARPAQGRLRALHGRAGQEPHRRQDRVHQAHDPHAPCRRRSDAEPEANEIILINSHDGASSYQMLAGVFRFVCCNGLVVGDVSNDIRIPHKGNIQDEVIEGAFRVLDDFEAVDASTDGMKALDARAATRSAPSRRRRWRCATASGREGQPPAPITAEQLIEARRPEDLGHSLWTTFQRVQENAMRGGQPGRSAQGRRMQHPRGRQHRPRREPEPGAVGAGRGDAEAQELIGSGDQFEPKLVADLRPPPAR